MLGIKDCVTKCLKTWRLPGEKEFRRDMGLFDNREEDVLIVTQCCHSNVSRRDRNPNPVRFTFCLRIREAGFGAAGSREFVVIRPSEEVTVKFSGSRCRSLMQFDYLFYKLHCSPVGLPESSFPEADVAITIS